MPDTVNNDWKNVYASNLNALRGRYPDLHESLTAISQEDLIHLIKPNPANKYPDVLLKNDSKKIFYYGDNDPMKYCRQFIGSLDLHYAPVLIFMGFGLGYQVASALNNFAKDLNIKHVVIIEKDIEIFRAALTTIDFSEIIAHPTVEFIIGAEQDNVFKSFVDYYKRYPDISHYFKSVKIIIMPSVRQVCAGYYDRAVEALKSSIMFFIQQIGNDPYDSICGVRYTLQNMKPIIEDPWINSFKNMFEGRPAILVGAGPSLNKDIESLKEASHKALLVCVDAALKPLLDKGIKPHVVTNMERGKGQSGFFSGLKGLDDTFFIYCSLVYPDTYASYHGPKIITHRYSEIMEWLGLDMDIISAGPLVGNYAFDIAKYFGCDPIIMVGQDLSIPATGPTHAEGMVFGTLEGYRKKNTVEVGGNSGETLLATWSFDESRRTLEDQIEKLDGLCINSTLSGAKINGTVLMAFNAAMDRYCTDPYDFTEHIKAVWLKEREKKKDKRKEIKKVSSILNQTLSELKDALKDCKKGIGLISDFESEFDLIIDEKPNPAIIEDVKLLDRDIHKLRKNIIFRPMFKFLATLFGGYYTNFCMRRNYLFDQFHDRRFATIKAFLMGKESLTIIGQLLLSTIYSIEDAKAEIEKELL